MMRRWINLCEAIKLGEQASETSLNFAADYVIKDAKTYRTFVDDGKRWSMRETDGKVFPDYQSAERKKAELQKQFPKRRFFTQIVRIVEAAEMLGEQASEPSFDESIAQNDRRKCEMALVAARHLLTAKGFAFLLGRLQFHDGPIMGEHGYYERKNDLVIVDATHYDLDGTIDSILHELGHRLYFRKSFLLRAKAFWKFFDPRTRQQVGPYGRQNHAEMFAELFRRFIRGRVGPDVVRWFEGLADA